MFQNPFCVLCISQTLWALWPSHSSAGSTSIRVKDRNSRNNVVKVCSRIIGMCLQYLNSVWKKHVLQKANMIMSFMVNSHKCHWGETISNFWARQTINLFLQVLNCPTLNSWGFTGSLLAVFSYLFYLSWSTIHTGIPHLAPCTTSWLFTLLCECMLIASEL